MASHPKGRSKKLSPAFATNVPTACLSEDQFQELERSGRCKLDQDSRQRLLKALDDYLCKIHVYRVAPRLNSRLKKRVKGIADYAKSLANELSESSETGQWILNEILDRPNVQPEEIEWIIRKLYYISASANDVARELKKLPQDKGGTAGDPYIRDLILTLHPIWKKAGGRGKGLTKNPVSVTYSGPFLDFLFSTNCFLGPYCAKSKNRIAKLIEPLLPQLLS